MRKRKMKKIVKVLATAALITAGAQAEAKVITAPVKVKLDGLFTAGTATYLSDASEELNSEIIQICGPNAILLKLDVRYKVVQGRVGADVSEAEMSGKVTCRTHE
jgi:hypothetical protein